MGQSDLILNELGIGLVILNQHRLITWNNDEFSTLFPNKKPVGALCHDFFEDSNIPCSNCLVSDVFLTGEKQSIEIYHDTAKRWFKYIIHPLFNDEGSVTSVLLALIDINEHKDAQENLNRTKRQYQSLLNNINDIVYRLDVDGKIDYCSPYVKKLLGYTSDEVKGKDFLDYIHADDQEKLKSFFSLSLSGMTERRNFRICSKDNKVYWVQAKSKPERKDGKVIGITGTLFDITEQILTEQELKKSLNEKEALLREVHHRVKNNLQVIISLLNLQMQTSMNDSNRLSLYRIQDRIRSMALVHENIYETDNFAWINFSRYIKALTTKLFYFHSDDYEKVKMNYELEQVPISLDCSIPLGLILNELTTNALLHAFPDKRKGNIFIILKGIGENQVEMVVKDDGVGLPANMEMASRQTIGLKLIRLLVGQLNGEMIFEQEDGSTVFRICCQTDISTSCL